MPYERKHVVTCKACPPGYEITYHELRGYDSPDKWYEVSYNGKRVLGDLRDVKACMKVIKQHASWDNEANRRAGN